MTETLTVECPHCRATAEHDPPADGEIKSARTCGECGEWHTIYERIG